MKTNFDETKTKIFWLIKDEKRTKEDLARILNIDERKVRSHISKMRKEGIPICSNSYERGYFLAKDRNDIIRTVNELEARAFDLLLTASRMKNYKLDGQVEVEL